MPSPSSLSSPPSPAKAIPISSGRPSRIPTSSSGSSALIRSHLDLLKIPYSFPITGIGVIANVDSGGPSIVTLCANMDALPLLGTIAGASHMIKDGTLSKVWKQIFCMQMDYQLPTGTIASHPGPTQAAVCFFEAKIEGRGGNVAGPLLTVDPVVVTSFSIHAMQQLIS